MVKNIYIYNVNNGKQTSESTAKGKTFCAEGRQNGEKLQYCRGILTFPALDIL